MKILKRLLVCVLFIPYGVTWLMSFFIWASLYPTVYIIIGIGFNDWMDKWADVIEIYDDFLSNIGKS